VSSVVDLLVSSEVALGLFAVGHRKRLRPLRIATDLERACRTGAQGKVVDVDGGAGWGKLLRERHLRGAGGGGHPSHQSTGARGETGRKAPDEPTA
jgi:hypothetical protein